MQLTLPELILSLLLFAVLFFGIGFIVNMLLKTTWLVSYIYPIFIILIVDKVSIFDYFTQPSTAFPALGHQVAALAASDIAVLAMGLVGAIASGITIKILRARGYTMF